ncbi:MAG: DUF6065 family protein [Pelagimonas sp.]|uniref:DUF6065 family protein n=1 Tax=Pelagimonas sp. TaxID=2073170 RepID=UPI003D6AE4AF
MTSLIKIHRLPHRDIKIQPAPVKRAWMDATHEKFAYRCLPLNMANTYGWQILNPSGFNVRMVDTEHGPDLEFAYDTPNDPPAVSHFGNGIVTFHIHALFTTAPGVSIYATGPANSPKQGVSPLAGIVETDWLPFTFTMNWRVMFKNAWIRFEKDDPICMFFPVKLAEIEEYTIEITDLADDPTLSAQFDAFAQSRSDFLSNLDALPDTPNKDRWQKHYFQGKADGVSPDRHITSLKLAQPKNAKSQEGS